MCWASDGVTPTTPTITGASSIAIPRLRKISENLKKYERCSYATYADPAMTLLDGERYRDPLKSW